MQVAGRGHGLERAARDLRRHGDWPREAVVHHAGEAGRIEAAHGGRPGCAVMSPRRQITETIRQSSILYLLAFIHPLSSMLYSRFSILCPLSSILYPRSSIHYGLRSMLYSLCSILHPQTSCRPYQRMQLCNFHFARVCMF